MSRLFALILSVSLAAVAASQDAQKPAAKAEDKRAEPKKDAEKPDEKPADGDEIDVHKTAERIAENAQKAGDRLKEKDPGADTRRIQDEIIKDIDALIKKAQNPPTPPMNSDMSPMTPPPKSDMPPPMGNMGGAGSPKNGMGGGTQPKSPMGMGSSGPSGGGSKAGRRPQRQRKPRGDSPMSMSEPMAKAGSDMNPMPAMPESKDPSGEKPSGGGFAKSSPKRQNDKLADLYKDVWGHLPDRLRQEMDLYYREKFMPRYSELLRQYYAALAEQRKKGSEDR
jgi:hypothetical protein